MSELMYSRVQTVGVSFFSCHASLVSLLPGCIKQQRYSDLRSEVDPLQWSAIFTDIAIGKSSGNVPLKKLLLRFEQSALIPWGPTRVYSTMSGGGNPAVVVPVFLCTAAFRQVASFAGSTTRNNRLLQIFRTLQNHQRVQCFSSIDFGCSLSSAIDDPLGVSCASSATPQTEDWEFESFDGVADTEFFRAKLSKKNTITEQLSGRGIVNIVVLEHNKKNVTILVQRALLYESMEKYKLGAEDL
ncbi:hypothetical protein Rs2_52400 [Raphanus sativus]|nr:hypothetical protein Rs2_52400 [Raphanus sativus]